MAWIAIEEMIIGMHALFVLTFGRHCAVFPIIDLALVVRSVGPSVGTLLGRGDEQTCCAAMRSVAVVIRGSSYAESDGQNNM